jgi:hypothetical protein
MAADMKLKLELEKALKYHPEWTEAPVNNVADNKPDPNKIRVTTVGISNAEDSARVEAVIFFVKSEEDLIAELKYFVQRVGYILKILSIRKDDNSIRKDILDKETLSKVIDELSKNIKVAPRPK